MGQVYAPGSLTFCSARAARGLAGALMLGHCAECDRLWREYEESVRAHLKIAGQWQVAMIQQDSSMLDALEPLHLRTIEKRTAARKAVRDHAATHAGQEPATKD